MKAFWDNRYNGQKYVYGKEPNGFFSTQLDQFSPGLFLLPGEGEGRNAVYAAMKGWTVDAFDQSFSGYEKAMDLVALIFFHVEIPMRKYLHQRIFESLKPGGTLVLEAFHKEQLGRDTGGPKSLEMLFDEQTLSSDFAAFESKILEKREIQLSEGSLHQGKASVIRFTGKKTQ